ncbi:hypothetical protein PTSG_12985 [Salpingoeca rosetta]|uniref:Uncharacterized protein n=1 Tax=Salpingoeca rosetta (strain ATCC 50818 / BSB-021) TaxID=946362 RepID=F2UPD3_SALR5|nr:uncharacterized protein PTSG_12985 [Salpingoeca rosetta]EGD79488.1 hypothetical protein PTSG_12985 [Salpingoeca rosetta]|eukprot:XP_004988969.1 hypothetical protein PTSG_12985 [Salpingoeca rosetta]
MFCNGRGCKYCDHMRWTTNQAIDGLFSNWITDSIVATSRPTREAIETHRIIQQFKDKGITAVINLQELHEHASCGPGNLQCGYAYDPDVFSSAGITTLIFGWQDFGVPSTEIAFDMVKVEFVKNFAAETLAKRRVFPDARDRTGVARVTPSTGIPILTQLRNQRLLLLQTEPQTLRFVPRVVYEIGKALSNVDWGAETSVDTLFTHRPDQLDEEGAGFLATYQIEANHGQWADLRACTSLDVLLVLAFEWEHAAGDAPINSAYVRHIETLIECRRAQFVRWATRGGEHHEKRPWF